MELGLNGRVALVTGASHGLGRAIAHSLAAEGAKVAINYHRNPERAEAVIRELHQQFGGEACHACADIAMGADVERMFDTVEAELGTVDVLVNNAAVCPVGPVTELTEDDWERAFAVNSKGLFLCCREFVRRLDAVERPGRIVNISSQAAFRGSQSGKSPYDASKGATIAFTVSLARELAPRGFGVNCVAPGFMYTEMIAPFVDADPTKFTSRVPLGRLAALAEVADVVTFLASARAGYMTGATVDVSGGVAMH